MTSVQPSGIGPVQDDQLHVMSCNIRLDLSRDHTRRGDADHWPERAPILAALLGAETPDILGVQEALFRQLPVIDQALPHHRLVGYGKDGGSRNQHCGIYCDTRRLEVLDWDQLWLSDTPRVIGSTSWGNVNPRIVTWARLRDRRQGTEFVHINTHFDHRPENARSKSAAAVLDLVDGEFADLPVMITGDFNAPAELSPAYRTPVDPGGLRDSWLVTEQQMTPAWGTFADYADPVPGGDRIDWLLVTAGPGRQVRVCQVAINNFRSDGRYPSDHLRPSRPRGTRST